MLPNERLGRSPGTVLSLAGALVVGGCAQEAGSDVECRRAGITGGTDHAELLALDARQERAICRIEVYDEFDEIAGLCSGTLVGDNVVLTAAHCLSAGRVKVSFTSLSRNEPARFEPVRLATHPTRDLAVLELPIGMSDSGIVPIAIDEVGIVATNDRVQIAGFGVTETGSVGALRFAVTSVNELMETTFRVSAERRAAACFGDSGGPALARNPEGTLVVTGVLSLGSRSCGDTDEYERLATAAGWIVDNATELVTPDRVLANCELLGTAGRCFTGGALYCEAGAPRHERCGAGSSCGFDRARQGFRCVPDGTDPCLGLGDRGRCDGNVRLSCRAGTVSASPCDACGAECVISAADGAAICNSAP